MGEFRMPSLGADMERGTVLEWRVHPGDEVHRGDIVAVVDTDKSDVDVEIFESGIVDELLVAEGEEVDVGTPLARIRPNGDVEATSPPAAPKPPRPVAPPPSDVSTRVHSPVIRRLATHLGVDLATVQGTGPDGRITRDDVEAAGARPAATVQAAPAAEPEVPPATTPDRPARDRSASMRRAIADLMARSKREIPHYYVAADIDMSATSRFLTERNASRPVTERLLAVVPLLKAAAVAARAIPELNGHWIDGAFVPSEHVHLGVAVRMRRGGLVAPAIHDADAMPLDDLMQHLQELVQRARSGRLRSSEMSDPTITVTQLGDQGVDAVYGVIYPAQVAMVGMGRIVERPWAVDGLLGVRPVLRATLAADHRASDGIVGARYLATLDRLLQEPEAL